MTNSIQVADSIRGLAKLYQNMVAAADALTVIGSLEQAEAEANNRLTDVNDLLSKAFSDLNQAQIKKSGIDKDVSSMIDSAKSKADEIIESAKLNAADIVGVASINAEEIIVRAGTLSNELIAQANEKSTAIIDGASINLGAINDEIELATGRVTALEKAESTIRVSIDSATSELSMLTNKLEDLKIKIRNLIG